MKLIRTILAGGLALVFTANLPAKPAWPLEDDQDSAAYQAAVESKDHSAIIVRKSGAKHGTAFQVAVKMKDLDAVRAFLAAGADPNDYTPGLSNTARAYPLFDASDLRPSKKSEEMARLLLTAGADPDGPKLFYDKGAPVEPPLSIALRNKDLGVVKVLLAAGADPNYKALELSWPVMAEAWNVETYKLLMEAGGSGYFLKRKDRGSVVSFLKVRSKHDKGLKKLVEWLEKTGYEDLDYEADRKAYEAARKAEKEAAKATLMDGRLQPGSYAYMATAQPVLNIGYGKSASVFYTILKLEEPMERADAKRTAKDRVTIPASWSVVGEKFFSCRKDCSDEIKADEDYAKKQKLPWLYRPQN